MQEHQLSRGDHQLCIESRLALQRSQIDEDWGQAENNYRHLRAEVDRVRGHLEASGLLSNTVSSAVVSTGVDSGNNLGPVTKPNFNRTENSRTFQSATTTRPNGSGFNRLEAGVHEINEERGNDEGTEARTNEPREAKGSAVHAKVLRHRHSQKSLPVRNNKRTGTSRRTNENISGRSHSRLLS
ncbi:unnamed protein product [Protopolystoma xenopodis]|uniref:Uncharacterized protein n=1 Tax=Protopolystoma xenopodis TaxID=117903 RepID=A0A448XM68_9PLAT|nr:unnamed protein product [Protopolystoma xenopodis]